MLGGAKEESSRILRRYYAGSFKRANTTVLGALEKFSAEHGALINGVQAHVLDYDDAQLTTLASRPMGQQVHPTAPVLAAALALAQDRRLSGAKLLSAYIVGIEVACRLGDAIDPSHYLDGLHPTGTLGAFGAAAACSHLLKLSPGSTRDALGIVGTLASGLRAHRGTMAKGLNAGHAARNGLLAATWAAAGFTASQNVFDDPMGFFSAMCRRRVDVELLRFGDPYFFARPGIALKLYPCAGVLHPALDLTIDLCRRHSINPSAIERIRATLDEKAALPLVYNSPKDALQGKFSLNFALAVAACDGAAGLKQFSNERVRDPDISQLMKRIELVRRPATRQKQRTGIDTQIEIIVKSGLRYSARAAFARGHPEKPASAGDIEEKFRGCAAGIVSQKKVDKFLTNFSNLERASSLSAWLGPLLLSRR
ncbi:MAG TPA: MmgE/PrpD family protein, partial [Candidatus Binatia bacterium]|nr:MmgE/PrpD family protein [Candidatus Binatia bacterium]